MGWKILRMNPGLQENTIRRSLVNAGVDPEMFDIKAHMDSTLTLNENLENIRRITGRDTRDPIGRWGHLMSKAKGAGLPLFRQIGSSALSLDEKLPAKLPGKRYAADGSRYYEYRKNRTDMPGRRT